jgi:hypothetical protein
MSESLNWSQDLVANQGIRAESGIMVIGFSKLMSSTNDLFRDFNLLLTSKAESSFGSRLDQSPRSRSRREVFRNDILGLNASSGDLGANGFVGNTL